MTDICVLEKLLDKLPLEPRNAMLYQKIGIMLLGLCDHENARNYLQRACGISCDRDSIFYYAKALYKTGAFSLASEVLEKYIETAPADRPVYELLSDSYYMTGEYGKAACSVMYGGSADG